MAKKLSKKVIHQQQCEESYNIAVAMFGFTPETTIEEKVRTLVFAANDILTEICQNADKIKIDMLEELSEKDIDIDSSRWKEFVQLAYKTIHGNISDELKEQLHEQQVKQSYAMTLRSSFINSYVFGTEPVQFPDKDTVKLPESTDEEEKDGFEDILKDAVVVRHYLNTVLWPAFRQLAEAAEFVTDFKLEYHQFKDLVDWEHYKEGGYPTENSKPKLWSILDKADYAIRLMKLYEFPQIDTLLSKFGLNVSCNQPHATRNVYSSKADVFVNWVIVAPRNKDIRIQLRMLENEACIMLGTNIAIYDIETRVVRCILPYNDFVAQLYNPNIPWSTTKVNDDFCELLAFDEVSMQYLTPQLKEYAGEIIYDECLHDIPSKSKRILDKKEEDILAPYGYYRLNIE